MRSRQRTALLWLCILAAQEAHGTAAAPPVRVAGAPGDPDQDASVLDPVGTRHLLQTRSSRCIAAGNIQSGATCVVSTLPSIGQGCDPAGDSLMLARSLADGQSISRVCDPPCWRLPPSPGRSVVLASCQSRELQPGCWQSCCHQGMRCVGGHPSWGWDGCLQLSGRGARQVRAAVALLCRQACCACTQFTLMLAAAHQWATRSVHTPRFVCWMRAGHVFRSASEMAALQARPTPEDLAAAARLDSSKRKCFACPPATYAFLEVGDSKDDDSATHASTHSGHAHGGRACTRLTLLGGRQTRNARR
jgi:hypothetical protein